MTRARPLSLAALLLTGCGADPSTAAGALGPSVQPTSAPARADEPSAGRSSAARPGGALTQAAGRFAAARPGDAAPAHGAGRFAGESGGAAPAHGAGRFAGESGDARATRARDASGRQSLRRRAPGDDAPASGAGRRYCRARPGDAAQPKSRDAPGRS
ncbi:MAG: hypothetical protein H6713_04345 [Myxococcales bacterium]|nr:hypothetical protein [Myxococcales bacterium]